MDHLLLDPGLGPDARRRLSHDGGLKRHVEVSTWTCCTTRKRKRFLVTLVSDGVLGRLAAFGRWRPLRLKLTGYSEKSDSLRQTGALHATLFAPGAQRAFMISPDSETRTR